jgi:phospho-N-acetylmuramoyl-pentapeptide-transferase
MVEWFGLSLISRAFLAALLSFLIVLFLGKPFIDCLRQKQLGQMIREVGPASHYSKKNTPTMGGLLILFSVLLTCLVCGNLSNPVLWLGLGVLFFTGLIGALDDGLKVWKKNSRGLSARFKYLGLSVIAIGASLLIYRLSPGGSVHIPLISQECSIGAWIILLDYFVLTGSANAVNLTDGQDGLVSFLVAIASVVFVIFALMGSDLWIYGQGLIGISTDFLSQRVPGSDELAVLGMAIAGASLGFLWFNAYPATVFMGDVGSLALGGTLGFMAIVLKLELLYLVVGFVFVIEALSVILQVSYFKWTKGKRIFRMSPIHHHFELSGIPESKVTLRFWLVGLIAAILSFWAF